MVPDLHAHSPAFELKIFAYGTLRRGQHNHHLCHGAAALEPASVTGRLYIPRHQGFPFLQVPEKRILTRGTRDYLGDAARQAATRIEHGGPFDPDRPEEDWGSVYGELITFHDVIRRLRNIDMLEGFTPGDPASLYQRVLLPVRTGSGALIAAWAYVKPELPPGCHWLESGNWLDFVAGAR